MKVARRAALMFHSASAISASINVRAADNSANRARSSCSCIFSFPLLFGDTNGSPGDRFWNPPVGRRVIRPRFQQIAEAWL